MDKKTKGRPRKCTDKQLIEIIKLYIVKNIKTPIKIKPTAVAEYGKELYPGINLHYQDFTRNAEAKRFIDNYNNKLKSKLSSKKGNQTPIYSTLDIDRFLAINNTDKKIRQSLGGLNQAMSDLVNRYASLEERFIKEKEQNLELKHKLNKISLELSNADKTLNNKLKEEKKKRGKIQQNNVILRRKVFLYEQFIKEYHLDEICQIALEIEDNIKFEENTVSFDIFKNKEKYKKGEYDLFEVVEAFQYLIRRVTLIKSEKDEDEEEFIGNYEEYELEELGNELMKEMEIDEDDLIDIEEADEDESKFVDFDDIVNIFDLD